MQKISNVMQCDFFAQENTCNIGLSTVGLSRCIVGGHWNILEHIGTIVTCDTLW